MRTLIDDPRLDGFSLLRRGERDAAFMDAEVSRRQTTAVMLTMINTVEQTNSYNDDGHRNVVCWVLAVLGTSRAEANALVAAARLVRDHPSIGTALADGHFGMPQIDELARLYGNDRVRRVLASKPELIGELIEFASIHTIAEFKIICKRVERNADPDGTLRDHDTARAERRLISSRRGTSHRIVADGDAVSGAVFDSVLERHVQAEFDKDWAEGRAIHGDLMCAGLMARTDRQRRYDAFMVMTRAAADALEHRCNGTGETGAPLVVIHVGSDTVADVIRNQGNQGNYKNTGASYRPSPVNAADLFRCPAETTDNTAGNDGDMLRRGAETSNGAPVSDNDLFIALLLGHVQRVIHDPADGHIIDLGRKRRLFTGAARQAALAEHHTCTHPGCGITGLGLQLDHNTPWAALMGATDQRNVRVKCSHHNRSKEKLGHRTERRTGIPGAFRTFRADGTEIAPRTSPATFRRRKHPPGATG